VRVEAEGQQSDTFITVAAMQEISRSIIPELVPETYKIGKATNAEGRKFQFSVIGLVEGDTGGGLGEDGR
jgi:hypothetical protein